MNYLDSILQSFGARTSGSPSRKIQRALRFIEHEEQQAAQTLVNLKHQSNKRTYSQMTYDEPVAFRSKVEEPPCKKQKIVTRSQSKGDAIAYRTRSHC